MFEPSAKSSAGGSANLSTLVPLLLDSIGNEWSGSPAVLRQALLDRETRLRLLLDQIPAVIWTTDSQLSFTSLAGAGLKPFGMSEDALRGHSLLELLNDSPTHRTAHQAHLRALAGERVEYDCEWRDHLFKCVVEPLRDAAGAILGVIGLGTDVTEQRQTEVAQREKEKQVQLVIQQIPAILWTTDADLRFTSVQGSGLNSASLQPAEVLGKPLQEYLGTADPMLLPILAHRKAVAGERAEFEFEWQRRLFQSVVEPLRGQDGAIRGVIGLAVDVTERRRTEKVLEQQLAAERRRARGLRTLLGLSTQLDSEAPLQPLLRRAVEGLRWELRLLGAAVYLADDEQRFVTLRAWDGLAPPARERTLPLSEKVPGPVQRESETGDAANRALQPAGPLGDGEGETKELLLPLLQGEATIGALWILAESPPPMDPLDMGMLRLFADRLAASIHRAKLYEEVRAHREQLQKLSERLVEVQEQERRHLARELHDEIGQALTGLQLQAEMAARSLGASSSEHLAEIRAVVQELMQRVRSLSLDLRPSMLDDLGLAPALLSLIQRYTKRTGIEVDFQHGDISERFPPKVETTAYRIVQEALTNVARHAGVSRVTVRMWTASRLLLLQVQDQGIGFSPRASPDGEATGGLQGIVERARLLGGEICVDSLPSEGTCLTAKLPLNENGDVYEDHRIAGR